MESWLEVRTLAANDVSPLRAMLSMFGHAFGDSATYELRQPADSYLQRLLSADTFVAVAAFVGDQVVGGVAGYVLPKFEQSRFQCHGQSSCLRTIIPFSFVPR